MEKGKSSPELDDDRFGDIVERQTVFSVDRVIAQRGYFGMTWSHAAQWLGCAVHSRFSHPGPTLATGDGGCRARQDTGSFVRFCWTFAQTRKRSIWVSSVGSRAHATFYVKSASSQRKLQRMRSGRSRVSGSDCSFGDSTAFVKPLRPSSCPGTICSAPISGT